MKNTNETPLANRKHIGIFGSTNAGKSLLFNRILNQELSIVSDIHGTTTDPVIKGIELIPYGPVAFIDTAGFGDISALDIAVANTSVDIRRTTIKDFLINGIK